MRAGQLRPPPNPLETFDRLAGAAGTPFLRLTPLDDDNGRRLILEQAPMLLANLTDATLATGNVEIADELG